MDPFLIFKLGAAVLIGLALGSYLAALAYRLPRGVQGARSACPSCGHVLGVADLVPVVSWVCLRGRCRYCHEPISARYTLIELGTAALVLALYWLIFEN